MRKLTVVAAGVTFLSAGLAMAAVPPAGDPIAANSHASQVVVHFDGERVKMIYHGTDGKPISAAAFNAAIKQGRHFSAAVDKNATTMTLLAVGAKSNLMQRRTANGKIEMVAIAPQPSVTIHPGQPLPLFSLPTVAGARVTPTMLRGKVTLVDFFFAQCVACIEEMPALNAFVKDHPQMNFLAVTFDNGAIAKKFVHKWHDTWPVAFNGMPLVQKLGVTGFPTLLLLGKNGKLLAQYVGGIPSGPQRAHGAAAAESQAVQKRFELKWLDHWVSAHTAAM